MIRQNSYCKEIKLKKQEPKITTDEKKVVPAASGSGFYINSSGYILTNNHVIEGCRKILTNNGKEFVANVIATDSKNDLAILKTNVRPNRYYKINKEDPKLLEDVIIAGYPWEKS